MSDKKAAIYTHQSNRAKRGGGGTGGGGSKPDQNKKVVFKGVLDTPFRVKWPSIPINVQNACLACVLSLLEGVASYHRNRPSRSRKRKREEQEQSSPSKKRKTTPPPADAASTSEATRIAVDTAAEPETQLVQPPVVLQHITVGINEVTKRLEEQIRATRQTIIVTPLNAPPSKDIPPSRPDIKVVIVCRADVDPPILIDHIPHLVAAYNSLPKALLSNAQSPPTELIKLITVPKGAEASLAEAMGLRRVSVIALENDTTTLSSFLPLLDSIPTLAAPWVSGEASFIPTHIKYIKTTAPKDIKAVKEARVQGRKAAKERRKASSAEKPIQPRT